MDRPSGTVYENGVFALDVVFPNDYPNSPPTIIFMTKMYHPNSKYLKFEHSLYRWKNMLRYFTKTVESSFEYRYCTSINSSNKYIYPIVLVK